MKVLDFGLAKVWETERGDSNSLAVTDPDSARDRGRGHPRHRGLHVARAGERQAGRPARRHLGLRRCGVGDAHRSQSLRGRHRHRRAGFGAQRAAGSGGLAGGHPARTPPPGRAGVSSASPGKGSSGSATPGSSLPTRRIRAVGLLRTPSNRRADPIVCERLPPGRWR